MERTLSDSQIRYIKARERRNLRGAQAFICLFLSLFVLILLQGVWLLISPQLACALLAPWAIFLWWWVLHRLKGQQSEVAARTQWLQGQFSATWVSSHRNGHFSYSFGDYPIAACCRLNNLFNEKRLDLHTRYRVEAALLTCSRTASHSYYLFGDTLVPVTRAPETDEQPGS